jgi:hypothetical protein
MAVGRLMANHSHLTGINTFVKGKRHNRELRKFRCFFQFPGKEIKVADYGDSS